MSGFVKILTLYFLFLLSCLVAVHLTGKSFKKINGVAVANESNIRSMLHNYQNVVLFFTDSKEVHTTQEYQNFQNLAKQYVNEREHLIIFARVQQSDVGQLLSQYKVDQFPTVILARKSKFYGFSGKFGQVDIERWIQRKGISPCLKLEEEKDFDYVKTEYDLSVIHTPNSPIALDKMIELARESEVFTCFHTYERKLAKYDFYLVSQFQPEGVELKLTQQQISLETLNQELLKLNIPSILEFDNRAIKLIFQDQTDVQGIFFLTLSKDSSLIKSLSKFAESRKGEKPYLIHSAKNDGHADNFVRLLEFLSVKETDLTPENAIVIGLRQEDRYRFEGVLNEQNLRKFISDFNQGKLKKHVKSEPIPAENNEPVRIVVSNSFQSEVIQNNKDVLVEFYAPWCGHCKKLAPIYEQIAIKLQKNSNIVIAKVDSTQNEIEGFQIEGYPTLKLFKTGDKQNPIDYQGDRTEESIIQFLKENTAHVWVE